MAEKEIHKTYSSKSTVVHWEPKKCIHSKLCWKGLMQVFNPQNRPWINMEGASDDRIRKQVDQCPSGALSWEAIGENEKSQIQNQGSIMKVTVSKNGPYLIKGKVEIEHSDGRIEQKEKVVALCRCGASKNKPYCDGNHSKEDFQA